MADFQDSVKRNIDNLLRLHLHDKDVYPRYGGMDLVDMRQVDWVEFNDVEAERKRAERRAGDQIVAPLLRQRNAATRDSGLVPSGKSVPYGILGHLLRRVRDVRSSLGSCISKLNGDFKRTRVQFK